jgi:hypothetical protein
MENLLAEITNILPLFSGALAVLFDRELKQPVDVLAIG